MGKQCAELEGQTARIGERGILKNIVGGDFASEQENMYSRGSKWVQQVGKQ